MVVAGAMIVSLAFAQPARSDVHVSVNIGTPPLLVVAPPPLVVVPGSPVYYAPGYEYNLFFYRGRYYTQFNGAWFFAPRIGAGWVTVSGSGRRRSSLIFPIDSIDGLTHGCRITGEPETGSSSFEGRCPP